MSNSIAIRSSAIVLTLAILLAPTVRAADPRVVKASHEEVVDNPPQENFNTQSDSQSDSLSYSPQWPEPPNTGAMLLRLGIGTLVVLGLCVGSLWIGKPWLQRMRVTGAGGSAMSVIESVALGNRAMLYLVRVGDAQLVAGTDLAGLKSLIAIPTSFKDVLEDRIESDDAEQPAAARSTRDRHDQNFEPKE